MLYIDSLDKIFYCPLKTNRLVDDSFGKEKYKNIESLEWSNEELECGKIIKIKGFPADKKVKLFRVSVSTDRTDYVATNDLSQSSTDVVPYCVQNSLENRGVPPRNKAINWH